MKFINMYLSKSMYTFTYNRCKKLERTLYDIAYRFNEYYHIQSFFNFLNIPAVIQLAGTS